MATAAELSLIIEAQNRASAVLRQIQQDVGRLGTSTAAPQKAFSGLFDTIKQGLGIAAGLRIFDTVGNAIGGAARSAIDFERTMSVVKAASGATGEQFKSLTNLALQLGKDTSLSASQAAAGIEELVKGGVSLADIMGGAAAASLNLAAAGGVSLAEASEIAANAMSQFGLKGSDMAKVSDLVAGAANASSLSVGEFRQSLSQVGAVANAAGQSFEETATAIAVMGAAGIKGSDAGTSLKTLLLSLQPATDKATAAFRELGIITAEGANRFFDASGRVKDLSEISGVLQQATAGLTEQQKLQRLETIFGSDAMRAAVVLAKSGSEGFAEMAGAMGKVTAEAVALQRLDNVAGDLEQLKGSAETAGIVLATTLAPAFRTVLQRATEFTNRFTQEAQTIVRTAQNIASEHGIGQIDAALIAVERRIGEVFGPGAQTVFHNLIGVVRDVGAAFGNVKDTFAPFAQDFAGFVTQQLPEGARRLNDVAQMLKGMTAATKENTTAANALHGAIGGLIGFAGLAGVVAIAAKVTLALGALATPVGILALAAVALGAAWATNFGGIQDIAKESADVAGQAMAAFGRGVVKLGDEFGMIGEAAQGAFAAASVGSQQLIDGFNKASDDAIAALNGLADWLRGLPGVVSGAATDAGNAIWQGLVGGINSGLQNVRNAAVGIAKNALAAAKQALEERSPSKAFARLGEDAVAGFVEGLEETGEAIEAAQEMAEGVLAAVEDILRDAPRSIGQLAGDLANALGAVVPQVLGPAEQAEVEFQQKREDRQRKHAARMRDLEEDLGGKQGKARDAVLESMREAEEQFTADVQRLTQERGDRVVDLERQQAERRGRAIRSFVDDFDDLSREVEQRAAEIGEATGRAVNEAIQEADRGIKEAQRSAAASIRDLQTALEASRTLRARREEFTGILSGAALKRQRDLEDAALVERNRQDLAEFDAATSPQSLAAVREKRQRDQEERDLEYERDRDLEEAKTDAERDGIRERFAQARNDLLRRRRLEDAERELRRAEDRKAIELRLAAEQDALARRRLAEQEDDRFRRTQAEALQALNDAIEDKGLQDAIKRMETERDSRVDALNQALEAKKAALYESERQERELLKESYRLKFEDLKKTLLGDIGPLLGEAQGFLDTFLAAILARTGDVMKAVGAMSGGGTSAPLSAPLRPGGKPGETAQEVANYYANLGLTPPPAVAAAAIFGDNPPQSAIDLLAANPDLSAGGGSGAITIPRFAGGGYVSGPTGAARLAVVHGGEQVLTPDQQRGGGGVQTIVVPVYLDGAEIARVTASPMQSEQNRLVRLGAV
jgi:TP901 family phage tail tape measure protein